MGRCVEITLKQLKQTLVCVHLNVHMFGSPCHGMHLHESSFPPLGEAGADDWVSSHVHVINA